MWGGILNMKTIIMLIFFLPLPIFAVSGWECIGDIDEEGRVRDTDIIGKRAFAAVNSLENVTVYFSDDLCKTWDTLARYNATEDPEWQNRLYNCRGMKVHPDGEIHLWGFSDALGFLVYDNNDPDFVEKKFYYHVHSDVFSFDMYDNEIGFANLPGKWYYTWDGWDTVDSSDFDNEHSILDNPKFINDSTLTCIAYNPVVDKIIYSMFNINTREFKDLYVFPHKSFFNLEFIDKYLIYSVGGQRTGVGDQRLDEIHRSRDGGLTWEEMTIEEYDTGFGLHEVSFRDEMNGITTGNWGKLYATNDGGENWKRVDFSDAYFPVKDTPNGPVSPKPSWVDTVPFFGTVQGTLYRYEGDFFDFDYEKISASALAAPEDATITEGAPRLTWEKQEGIEYYHLQVSEDPDISYWHDLIINEKLEKASYVTTGLEQGKTYYWHVLTVKGSQIRQSEIRSFTVGKVTALEIPEITSLCDVAYTADTLLVEWDPIPGAEEYQIELSEGSDYHPVDTVTAAASNHIFRELGYGRFLYTRIRGVTGEVISEWSDYCHSELYLESPEQIYPDCGAVNIPQDDSLRWQEYVYPYVVELLIATDQDFENEVEYLPSTTKSSYPIGEKLKPETEYFWKIRTYIDIDEGATSDWSDICSFTTGPWLSVESSPESFYNIIMADRSIYIESAKPISLIELIDINGKVVSSSSANTISTSVLARGIYFLIINGKFRFRVMI